jgi:ribosomal protein L39E
LSKTLLLNNKWNPTTPVLLLRLCEQARFWRDCKLSRNHQKEKLLRAPTQNNSFPTFTRIDRQRRHHAHCTHHHPCRCSYYYYSVTTLLVVVQAAVGSDDSMGAADDGDAAADVAVACDAVAMDADGDCTCRELLGLGEEDEIPQRLKVAAAL